MSNESQLTRSIAGIHLDSPTDFHLRNVFVKAALRLGMTPVQVEDVLHLCGDGDESLAADLIVRLIKAAP